MAVKRTEIPYVEAFENILFAGYERFKRIVEPQDASTVFLFDKMSLAQEIIYAKPQGVVALGCVEVSQI